tara:strand:- start:10589 stop:11551 length:963 start_codon:yes stop_codon:yes gene_type:complete
MAKPNSKDTFKDYVLRSLGAPVIEINVDDDQLDDRVDEALQFYQEYHADSIERFFLKHKVTASVLTIPNVIGTAFEAQEEIVGQTSGAKAKLFKIETGKLTYKVTTNQTAFQVNETVVGSTSGASETVSAITVGDIENGYLPTSEFITQVVRVLPIRDDVTSSDMFDVRYQLHLHDLYNLGFMGSLAEYVMSMQYLDMLDKVIDSDQKQINFDRHKNRIEIFMDWDEEVTVGEHIVVECYRVIDPDTFTDVYNDYYLKKYAAALVKKQWGLNLLKFEGMQMPGGVQFNGRQIYDDAVADLEKLEEEARLNWEQPVDFYTG